MSSLGQYRYLLLLLSLGCSEREPPAILAPKQQLVRANPERQNNDTAVPSATVVPATASVQEPEAAPRPLAGGPSTVVSPSETPTTPTAEVRLLDEQGQPLPQTDTMPTFDSASFKQRMELLFRAIVEDRVETAEPAFFPVVAYEQVKAIEKPARDHKYRLMTAFYRNIHEYHRNVARFPSPIRLVSIEPSTQAARWMKPGSEGNKLGYFRMLRAHLKYADGNGQNHLLEITSMISWRGEWYVVHLDGFK